ncbi:hypothetical protein FBQ99_20495 [Chloroflexi bacterium CFX2]|nr:hypothetical protein [Chloroflexi bacterium CFX2]
MKQSFSRNNSLYLFLSFLASLIELGPVILLLVTKNSILSALFVGLCYQLGNIIPGVVRLPRKLLVITIIVGCLFSVVSSHSPFAFYISVTLASIGLQSLRRAISSKGDLMVTTFTKRLSRIAGFAVSGMFSYWMISIILLILIIVSLIVTQDSHAKPKLPLPTPLALIMIIHQSHYFSYAYILPALLLLHLHVPATLVGVYFIVGWLSYISTERIVHSKKYIHILIAGHILVAFSLTLLGFFYWSLPLVIFSWFFSGLGGGTVYCITIINRQLVLKSHTEIEFWEDVGHVTGVGLSIILAISLISSPFRMFYVSALIAIITALGVALSKGWIVRNSNTVSSLSPK